MSIITRGGAFEYKTPGKNIFGRIIGLDGDNLDLKKSFYILFEDLAEGSGFSMSSSIFEESECSLILKDRELVDRIIGSDNLTLAKPVIIELDIFGFTNIPSNKFNPIYFLDAIDVKHQLDAFGRYREDYTLIFRDFTAIVDQRTIADHNQDKITQGKFHPNEITVQNKQPYNTFIRELYDMNVKNPVKKVKNTKVHSAKDATRKMSALGTMNYQSNNLNYITLTWYEKKSLFDIKQQFLNSVNNQKFVGYPQTFLKINESTRKFDVYFRIENDIVIDYTYNSRQYPIYFGYTFDNADVYQHIVVESNKDPYDEDGKPDISDTSIVQEVIDNVKYDWKKNEVRETESPNEDENIAINSTQYKYPLSEKARDIKGQQKLKDGIEIEMNFDDLLYFQDIQAGMKLVLKNFPQKEFNGRYFIQKITAVVEQTTISFSMDKLKKIEED